MARKAPAPKRQRPERSTTVDAPQAFTVTTYRPPDGVPEFLVDGIAGLAVINGLIKISFFSGGLNPDDPSIGTTNVRLSLSLSVFPGLHEALGKVLADLRQNGMIPTEKKS